jgi:hypothetical protein
VNGYIHNVVVGCPGATWDEYLKEGRALASFYAELLGMRIIREDWFKIATDEDSSFNLAFGEGPGEYRPPRWPDPEHPQQMHLDIFVNDLESAEKLVLGLGASPLQDKGDYRSYADPVGHPFCLYLNADQPDGPGRVGRVVFDCFSPRALATFYEELLDMRTRVESSPGRVVIAKGDGTLPMLAFQQAEFTAPRWPDPAYPSQMHLDLYFDDASAAKELAERLGAIRLPKGGTCPVYADPAAHPFCLCSPGQ